MKLSDSARDALIWADLKGLSPSHFRSDDLFVGDGIVVPLEHADPEVMVWLPRMPTLAKVLRRKLKVTVVQKLCGRSHLLSAEYRGVLVEGAGLTETEAILSFLERLRDADKCRMLKPDRPGSSEGH